MLEPLEALRILKLRVSLDALNRKDTPTQTLCMPIVLRIVKKAAATIFDWMLPKLAAVVFQIEGERGPLALLNKTLLLSYCRRNLTRLATEDPWSLRETPHMAKHHVPCADILIAGKFVFA